MFGVSEARLARVLDLVPHTLQYRLSGERYALSDASEMEAKRDKKCLKVHISESIHRIYVTSKLSIPATPVHYLMTSAFSLVFPCSSPFLLGTLLKL